MEGRSWNLETVLNPRYNWATAAGNIPADEELVQMQAANVLARAELAQVLEQTRQVHTANALVYRQA